MIKIYALFNPVTETYFYVGATGLDLNKRLNGHMSSTDKNKDKVAIISSILKENKRPEIILLEEVDISVSTEREAYWMDKMIKSGHFIVNKCFKGKGRKPSDNAKVQVNLGFTEEVIELHGGKDKFKEVLYKFIEDYIADEEAKEVSKEMFND